MVYQFQGRVNLKDLNHDLQEFKNAHGLDDNQMNKKLENLMNAFADMEIRPSSMGVFGPYSVIDSDTFTEMTEEDRLKLPTRTLNTTSKLVGGALHKSKLDAIADIQKSLLHGDGDESEAEVVSPTSIIEKTSPPEKGFMARFRRSEVASRKRSPSPTPVALEDAARGRGVSPVPCDVSEEIQEKYGKSNKWAEISELRKAKSLGDVKLMFTVDKLKQILQNNSVEYGKSSLKEPLAKMVWSGLSEGSLK